MAIPVNLEGLDEKGAVKNTSIITRDKCSGPVVFVENRLEFLPETKPFINPSFGAAMNQNVGFGGNPTVIHAGVNSGALLTGTTTGTTSNHLIDSGETFSEIAVGMSVKNTTSGTEYALVTEVSSNDLTLDADILVSGENYEINPIWVGTAVAGAWNFADSAKITITSANNNDEASFANDTNQNWNLDSTTTLTGKIDLDTYNPATNTILIYFDLNGVQVGDQLNLNNYIDTSDFTEQTFTIPKSDFNFGTTIINGMTLFMTRSGGSRPTVKFDDIQWEETGDIIEFAVEPQGNEKFYVRELVFTIRDADVGVVAVSGATQNYALNNVSPDAFLGVSSLTNGLLYRRIQDNITRVALLFKDVGSILSIGGKMDIPIGDATNTQINIRLEFKFPALLNGRNNDKLSVSISDDLSGLTVMSAFAIGYIEK